MGGQSTAFFCTLTPKSQPIWERLQRAMRRGNLRQMKKQVALLEAVAASQKAGQGA